MHRLIVLRHAKSDYPPGVGDHDRPLSDRGLRNAQTIAGRLRLHLPEDASVSAAVSTAARAQRTWEVVQQGLSIPSWSDRTLYLAEPLILLEVASAFETDIGVIVGHNPGLEELARSARGARQVQDMKTSIALREKFPTSAFAVLDSPAGVWAMGHLTCTAFAVCR